MENALVAVTDFVHIFKEQPSASVFILPRLPKRSTILFCVMGLFYALLSYSSCWALEANEIFVIANRNARKSVGLAKQYMKQRGIPRENLLRISIAADETCARKDYEKRIAEPIRKKMLKLPPAQRPRCLVLMKGVPLRIRSVPLSDAEKQEIDALKAERKKLEDQLQNVPDERDKNPIHSSLSDVKTRIRQFQKVHNTGASVDSELMLVLSDDYPLAMWVPNPFFLGFKDRVLDISKNDVIMVSRLDAPTHEIVLRIIDDAISTEKKGLTGTAYFDARYKYPEEKKVSGYGLYDKSIHLAATQVRKKSVMPVVLEDSSKLFKPGDCPQAALYCGWYRLARYVDAFEWVPGSIGYHIASSECQTLREGPSQVWCKRMLEEGVTATVGPVEEPYVQAFPMPEVFFATLVDGAFTLSECYLLSLPYLSWKMVLVGDPLYQPFGNRHNQ